MWKTEDWTNERIECAFCIWNIHCVCPFAREDLLSSFDPPSMTMETPHIMHRNIMCVCLVFYAVGESLCVAHVERIYNTVPMGSPVIIICKNILYIYMIKIGNLYFLYRTWLSKLINEAYVMTLELWILFFIILYLYYLNLLM